MAPALHDPANAERIDRVRRVLLRAGWMIPVMLSVRVPLDALAQYEKPAPDPCPCEEIPSDPTK